MRRPSPFVSVLLVAWLVSYVAFGLGHRLAPATFGMLYDALTLDARALGSHPWGPVSYALLHSPASVTHLLFNAMGLYFFGVDMERRWGTRRFAWLSLAAALVGALFVVAGSLVGLTSGAAVGGSAIVMAHTIAWGLTHRERQVYFLFFPVSGLQLVGILVALQVLEALSLSPVSAAAHFGGMLVGWLAADGSALRRRFARYRARVNQRAREQANVRQARDIAARAVRELRVIEGGKKDPRKPNDSRLN